MTITVPGIVVVGLLSLHQDSASAWVTVPTLRPSISSASHLFSTGSDGVSSISLKNVVNHEEEGAKMAKSITAWLDAEVSNFSFLVVPTVLFCFDETTVTVISSLFSYRTLLFHLLVDAPRCSLSHGRIGQEIVYQLPGDW